MVFTLLLLTIYNATQMLITTRIRIETTSEMRPGFGQLSIQEYPIKKLG